MRTLFFPSIHTHFESWHTRTPFDPLSHLGPYVLHRGLLWQVGLYLKFRFTYRLLWHFYLYSMFVFNHKSLLWHMGLYFKSLCINRGLSWHMSLHSKSLVIHGGLSWHMSLYSRYLCTHIGLLWHTQFTTSISLHLRVDFLLKTDSGYPRDAEVTLFALANPEHSLRFSTHWSAQPVSALARSGGPRKMSQSPVSRNSNIERRMDRPRAVVGVIRGVA